jgi:copper chaperone CopZ
MQRTISLTLLASAALALGACSATPQTTADTGADTSADAGAQQASLDLLSGPGATLIVHGLSCPLCATNVDKQLRALPGVRSVKVNLGNGEIGVSFSPAGAPTNDQLAKAVTESGFTLVSINRN